MTSFTASPARVFWHDVPHQPERRLRNAHRPHGAVKVTPLVPFTLCGRLHPWKLSKKPEQPDRAGDWKIRMRVDLFRYQMPRDDGHHEPGDVQQRERSRPRSRRTYSRFADTSGFRLSSVKRMMYGAGSNAGKATAQPGDAGSQNDGPEP